MGLSYRPAARESGVPGPKNLITDVPGVLVGHSTVATDEYNTGVTAILPRSGNLYEHKVVAGCHVINGYGKSVGLMQIGEMGAIETPILLTNTFSVGACMDALFKYMVKTDPEIGGEVGTVNPLVLECFDGHLSNIRGFAVSDENVLEAIQAAGPDFEEGAVGAGRGMSCYELKSGIGSASRVVSVGGREFTVGCLVNTNFGSMCDLRVYDDFCGGELAEKAGEPDKGSIIILLATDLPMSSRQLTRACRRAQNGIARTGSYTGNWSGDIAVMFSTAYDLPHTTDDYFTQVTAMHETAMNTVFRAVTEVVEESILSSLLHATRVEGWNGSVRESLRDLRDCEAYVSKEAADSARKQPGGANP